MESNLCGQEEIPKPLAPAGHLVTVEEKMGSRTKDKRVKMGGQSSPKR